MAAPMDQLPSLPTRNLGDFELAIISDGTYFLDGGSVFGVVPKSLWSKRVQVNERNLLAIGTNSVLVRTGKQNIIVETGIGNKLSEKMKAIFGPQEQFMENFLKTGLSPDDVDIVINSHLHFDHCGWNTVFKDGKAVATFPRAKYYAPRGEWEHGHKQLERDRISYISDNYDPLIESGQMQLLDGDAEIAPGISVRVYPGHTRYMQAVLIQSGGRTACYISDLIPTSHHIDLTWMLSYDLFPLDTIESRKRYYAESMPGQWLTIFTHDHEVPWGHIESPNTGKYTLRPAELRYS